MGAIRRPGARGWRVRAQFPLIWTVWGPVYIPHLRSHTPNFPIRTVWCPVYTPHLRSHTPNFLIHTLLYWWQIVPQQQCFLVTRPLQCDRLWIGLAQELVPTPV